MQNLDVIIIGAGAAGLMCAIEAGKRNRKVLLLDHSNKLGKKILMSGGGKCNFTNQNIRPTCYISNNPHFCKSALSRFTPWDFINLVEKNNIPYHEKTLGQLFCNNKSSDIVNMLKLECDKYKVTINLKTEIKSVQRLPNNQYKITINKNNTISILLCNSLVIASGGLSIPTMGASPFGYKIAEQFGIKIWPTRAGLVPFTLYPKDKDTFSELSGLSFESIITVENSEIKNIEFRENSLFTHRGLSGPAILQISSYWQPGKNININSLPNYNLENILNLAKKNKEQKQLKSLLSHYLPKRLIEKLIPEYLAQKKCYLLNNIEIQSIIKYICNWQLKPSGTEGYRTAEVTLGGVDCDAFSSKTMESKSIPGLYFIGEVLDVTGWLGGYNFQWAWSSGYVAGQVV